MECSCASTGVSFSSRKGQETINDGLNERSKTEVKQRYVIAAHEAFKRTIALKQPHYLVLAFIFLSL